MDGDCEPEGWSAFDDMGGKAKGNAGCGCFFPGTVLKRHFGDSPEIGTGGRGPRRAAVLAPEGLRMSPAGRHFGLLAVASAKRPEDVVDCAPSPYVSYKLRNVDDATRQQ